MSRFLSRARIWFAASLHSLLREQHGILLVRVASFGTVLGLIALAIGYGGGSRAGLRVHFSAPSDDTVTVYGPRTFTTPTGSRQLFVERFGVSGEVRAYTLVLDNGAADGTLRASEASVRLNGHVVISRSQVTTSVPRLERAVDLLPEDTLQVEVKGVAGAFVTLRIIGVPDPTFPIFGPEQVVQTASHETEVTRTFTLPVDAAAPFVLHVVNGRADGTGRVDGARVKLNGTKIIRGPSQDDDDDVESCDSSDDDDAHDDDDDDGDDDDDEDDDDDGGGFGPLRLCRNIGALWKTVLLQPTNTIKITLRGPTGSEVTVRVTAQDATQPVLTIASPAPGALTNEVEIAVTGTVTDRTATVVTANGIVAARDGSAYAATVPLPADGENLITVIATDAGGLHTDSTRTLSRTARRRCSR